MREGQADLQLFIDLGFILLAAFFLLTEQMPRLQVPLPQETEQSESAPVIYEVHFDERMQVMLLRQSDQEVFCTSTNVSEARACMRRVKTERPGSLLVLSPQGGSTLQQMVSLLDLCLAEGLSCSVAGGS
ncbi:MAG: hypothetical protein OXU68_04425 [Bacteroidota bacterium]|nr:hypothetical protein [Bacteroidota bacterium]MDE2956243.1 hypothetical protein [Bacteroidota bacterium]